MLHRGTAAASRTLALKGAKQSLSPKMEQSSQDNAIPRASLASRIKSSQVLHSFQNPGIDHTIACKPPDPMMPLKSASKAPKQAGRSKNRGLRTLTSPPTRDVVGIEFQK